MLTRTDIREIETAAADTARFVVAAGETAFGRDADPAVFASFVADAFAPDDREIVRGIARASFARYREIAETGTDPDRADAVIGGYRVA